jgi:predicted dehydrogenase
MPATYEMRRLYREGKIGEFEYGEGEYIHNCEPIWPSITYGEADHWRNNMYATFYCTHSLGPMIHITGLRPVSVIGMEGTKAERRRRVGSKAAAFGVEMVTLENGGIIKSVHGGLYKNSVWYSVYGSHGRMESGREDAGDSVDLLYVNADDYDGEYAPHEVLRYKPAEKAAEESAAFGHGGSDYYSMYNFVQKILGDESADTIDVYEALDMSMPGLFAYRSVLQGGVSVPIPNLRDPAQREKWRNDTACTDPRVAGDQLLPTMSTGTPQIGKEVYDRVYKLWRKDFEAQNGYTNAAMTQGSKTE